MQTRKHEGNVNSERKIARCKMHSVFSHLLQNFCFEAHREHIKFEISRSVWTYWIATCDICAHVTCWLRNGSDCWCARSFESCLNAVITVFAEFRCSCLTVRVLLTPTYLLLIVIAWFASISNNFNCGGNLGTRKAFPFTVTCHNTNVQCFARDPMRPAPSSPKADNNASLKASLSALSQKIIQGKDDAAQTPPTVALKAHTARTGAIMRSMMR